MPTSTAESCRISLHYLAPTAGAQRIRKAMLPYGTLLNLNRVRQPNGQSTCFITFERRADAEAMLKACEDGLVKISGRPLVGKIANPIETTAPVKKKLRRGQLYTCEPSTAFERLPAELCFKIFDEVDAFSLCRLRPVSRSFFNLIKGYLLSVRELVVPHVGFPSRFFTKNGRSSEFSKKCDEFALPSNPTWDLTRLFDKSRLVKLDLLETRVNYNRLRMILKATKSLRELALRSDDLKGLQALKPNTLTSLSWRTKTFDAMECNRAIERQKCTLTHLNIQSRHIPILDDTVLSLSNIECLQLELVSADTVDLRNCDLSKLRELVIASSVVLPALAPVLKVLVSRDVTMPPNIPLSTACPHLETFLSNSARYISRADLTGHKDLRKLKCLFSDATTSVCLKLDELDISHSCELKDAGLVELLTNNTGLRKLTATKLCQVTSKGVAFALDLCAKISYIDVSDCLLVSPEDVIGKTQRRNTPLRMKISPSPGSSGSDHKSLEDKLNTLYSEALNIRVEVCKRTFEGDCCVVDSDDTDDDEDDDYIEGLMDQIGMDNVYDDDDFDDDDLIDHWGI